jgi:hypothetical protein
VRFLTNAARTAVLEGVVNHNGQTEMFQGGIMHSSPGLRIANTGPGDSE